MCGATELPPPNVPTSHGSYIKMIPDKNGILHFPRCTFLVSLWCVFLTYAYVSYYFIVTTIIII
jgi:hypothetical protein